MVKFFPRFPTSLFAHFSTLFAGVSFSPRRPMQLISSPFLQVPCCWILLESECGGPSVPRDGELYGGWIRTFKTNIKMLLQVLYELFYTGLGQFVAAYAPNATFAALTNPFLVGTLVSFSGRKCSICEVSGWLIAIVCRCPCSVRGHHGILAVLALLPQYAFSRCFLSRLGQSFGQSLTSLILQTRSTISWEPYLFSPVGGSSVPPLGGIFTNFTQCGTARSSAQPTSWVSSSRLVVRHAELTVCHPP